MPAQPGRAIRATETSNVSETPTSSASRTETPSPRDMVKEISDLINRVKSLQGEEKEQAAVYLKDVTSNLDF